MAPFDLHVMGAGIHTQRTHIFKQTTTAIIIIVINNGIGGKLYDCVEVEGEENQGRTKKREEIRVAVSGTGRDVREV